MFVVTAFHKPGEVRQHYLLRTLNRMPELFSAQSRRSMLFRITEIRDNIDYDARDVKMTLHCVRLGTKIAWFSDPEAADYFAAGLEQMGEVPEVTTEQVSLI